MSKEAPNPIEKAGREFHDLMFNLTLHLGTDLLESTQNLPDESGREEIAQRVDRSLLEFEGFDEQMREYPEEITIHGFPRLKREERDKIRLQPGEHAGVSIHIHLRGNTTFLNAYGGIRKPQAYEDIHDTDRSRRRLHSVRSERIASQRTHLNMHIVGPSGLKTAEVWFMRDPNKNLALTGMSDDEGRIDTQKQPKLKKDEPYHEEYSNRLSSVLNSLAKLIPSQ